MSPQDRYEIIYSEDSVKHVLRIDRRYWNLIRDTLREQLTFQPNVRTRNRKPLERSVVITVDEDTSPSDLVDIWELRFGVRNAFRVLYRLDFDVHQVQILAVLIKVGNRYYAGDEEYEL